MSRFLFSLPFKGCSDCEGSLNKSFNAGRNFVQNRYFRILCASRFIGGLGLIAHQNREGGVLHSV